MTRKEALEKLQFDNEDLDYADELTQEEYDLLKEILGNDK